MAAKKRKLLLLGAAVALVAAPTVFASVPRSTFLESASIDFRTVEPVDVDASIDNGELLARALDRSFPASAPVDTLSESRVWVSRLSQPLFHQESDGLTRSLRQGSVVAWSEVASDPTVLTPDPEGYADSSNLYAFGAGDPVNNSDPTGRLCESGNADGLWDRLKRCSQDVFSVQDEFHAGIILQPGKTAGRAAAGLVGTGAMIGKTVVGVGAIAIDTALMQVGNEAAAVRQAQRVVGVANAVLHPIDTVVESHTQAAQKILQHEQQGEWFQGSMVAGEVGAADAAAVAGAVQGGVGLARFVRNTTTKLAVEQIGIRAYEKSILASSRDMVQRQGRSIWARSFNVDLGREAGARAQRVIQRWSRSQTGEFASASWAFGDIAPQFRMFPPISPLTNPLVSNPRSFVIPDVYYRPLSIGLDFKLTNYKNLPQDWGYATYLPLSEITKVIYNPYAY